MKRLRLLLKVVGGLLMAVLIVIGSALLTGNLGRPVLYQFSPDYKGWVVVAYDKPGCSPLSKDGVYLVVSIPFFRSCLHV